MARTGAEAYRCQMRVIRLVSWNVDGLPRALAPTKAGSPSLAQLHDHLGSPDVLCLQEVRVRPGDTDTIARMEAALPGFVCRHALASDSANARFRGGRTYGVATYVRSELGPRWLPAPEWDREGRLLLCELPEWKLVVANVYAVNGTDKPYFDHALGRFEGDRHAFKLRFQQRLLTHFQALRGLGELVLLGDWNVSRTALDTYPRLRTEPPHSRARAMLNDELLPQLDLVDVFRELHPELRKYTWFQRTAARYGRLDAARVDYALLSRSLLSNVREADVAHEQVFALGSDHAPLWLTMELHGGTSRHETRSASV